MSGASAFDPSSWADDTDDAEIASEVDQLWDEQPAAARREALDTELADLRELERSTQAQLDKASATVTAAKVELSRLRKRIADIEQEINPPQSEG